ncbi:excalibur calcium-binding domain-containing protein [Neisseria sp. 74A18]|uniref:excalibur calcium-binding domain-containing protein n=1 Tax=Neisseria sp. 74A18 TaxID=1696094 RepID=UPI0018D12E23|nr:excalibur calcium-binding domain-containing protein [Neisseria sp. 74A18]
MRWDYELGFGFIKEEQTKSEIFAHIGEFETENPPPRDGETVSFDIVSNSHGTEEAKNIEYTNRRRKPVAVDIETEEDSPKNLSLWLKGMVAALVGIPLLGAAGYYGLSRWQDYQAEHRVTGVMVDQVADKMMAEREAWKRAVESPAQRKAASAQTNTKQQINGVESPAQRKAASPFKCDGRTHCSQMKSFAEAQYFLEYCPNVKMDGDHDGIPCEEQFADEIKQAGMDTGKNNGSIGSKLAGMFDDKDNDNERGGIWSDNDGGRKRR